MLRRTAAILLAFLFIVALPLSSASQTDEEPDPGVKASAGLPDTALFGDGWIQAEIVSPDSIERYGFTMSPDVFSEGAAGIYVGPEGSRALVVNLIVSNNRVAIRASWDDASDLLRTLSRPIESDYNRDSQLETMMPPEGCLEAKRAEGIESTFRLPAGATLCAANDDSLIIVVTYGSVNELTGVAAADSVVSQIIEPNP